MTMRIFNVSTNVIHNIVQGIYSIKLPTLVIPSFSESLYKGTVKKQLQDDYIKSVVEIRKEVESFGRTIK